MNQLLHLLSEAYGLRVKHYQILRDRTKSFVVKLQTNRGTYLGKSLNNDVTRQRFILDAEAFLRNQGIAIPKVLPTNRDQMVVHWRDRPMVLQDWVVGKAYRLDTDNRLQKIAAELGRMHRFSRGYESPSEALYNGALSWEHEYQTDIRTMQQWPETPQTTSEQKKKAILSRLLFFQETGKTAYLMLKKSTYFKKWRKQPLPAHFLCHGDFHLKNIIQSKQQITIIDWEDVRFDFPSKDITRLLNAVLEEDKIWLPRRFELLLNAYLEQNPLTLKELGLLYIDLTFPHIFERFLRKRLDRRHSLQELNQFLQRETDKAVFMQERAQAIL